MLITELAGFLLGIRPSFPRQVLTREAKGSYYNSKYSAANELKKIK
jgi:hypothetical protein